MDEAQQVTLRSRDTERSRFRGFQSTTVGAMSYVTIHWEKAIVYEMYHVVLELTRKAHLESTKV